MAISPSSPASYKPVCRFWLKGCCKYGSKCRFLHPDNQSPVAAKKLAPPSASAAVFKKTAPTSAAIKKKVATTTAAIKNETPTKAERTKTAVIKNVAPPQKETPTKAEKTEAAAINKVAPIKKETPTKAETTKTAAVKKVAPIEKETPTKAETTKTAVIKKVAPTEKETPTKAEKTEAAAINKVAPIKKETPTKAETTETAAIKKVAPTEKETPTKAEKTEAAAINKVAPIIKETPTKAETTETAAIKKVAPTEKETPTKAETTETSASVAETAIESFSGAFSSLANLQGHKKDVTGIVLPTGSDNLFTSSSDGIMCIWNCNTGECVASGHLGGEIGCLISEGTWIFAGLKNLIKAWNVANNSGGEPICLNHSMGQVYSMEADEDLLYAGTQEGSILVWRGSCEATPFKLVASLKGHSKGVLCLAIGRGILYSGAMDHTARVWDPKNFQCLNVLKGHSGYVTSLLCWDVVLLTSSLDKTVNAWAYEDGELKVVHSHQEEDGVIKLSGLQQDAGTDPTLFCCLKDNSVRLYDLPSFAEKGRICSKKEVKAMKTGPGSLFFTGDGTGKVTVWNYFGEPSKVVAA
ncbi:hypothetical protein SLA2020_021120 [Shorea laevis]